MAVTITLIFQNEGNGVGIKKEMTPTGSGATENEQFVANLLDEIVTAAIEEIMNPNKKVGVINVQ
ncbi:TPA: hypothetical protein ACS777_003556 [Providencia alcalifaciens]